MADHGQCRCDAALLHQVHNQVQKAGGIVSLGAHSHQDSSYYPHYLQTPQLVNRPLQATMSGMEREVCTFRHLVKA